jgi:hypothetical protein
MLLLKQPVALVAYIVEHLERPMSKKKEYQLI